MRVFVKNILLVVCCAAVLLINSIGVSASVNGHLCVGERNNNSFKPYPDSKFVDRGTSHALLGTYQVFCKVCSRDMGIEEDYGDYQSHSYTSFENAGHEGLFHYFILHCGVCGHSERVALACKYEQTGYHVAPW